MDIIVNILVFALSLSLVIILHELGHFIMARRAGILCHEFALGMGPVVWKKKIGETVYMVKLIPIGGYVAMAGEEVNDELVRVGKKVRLVIEGDLVTKIVLDHTDDRYQDALLVEVEKVDLKGEGMTRLYINEYEVKRDAFYVLKRKEYQIAPHERGFDGKTKWQRFWAIFAGPLMNFILAFFIFLLLNFIVGFPKMDEPIIGSVGDNSPAGVVLQEGDKIIEVEGNRIDTWDDLSMYLGEDITDREVSIKVDRDGETLSFDLVPTLYFYSIGVHSKFNEVNEVIIGDIAEGSLAEKFMFEAGDQITKIGDLDIQGWTDFILEIERIGAMSLEDQKAAGFRKDVDGKEVYEIEFTVLRDGELEVLVVEDPYSTAFLESQGISIVDSRIGIAPGYEFKFFASFGESLKNVGESASIIFTTIGLLIDSEGAGASVGVDDLAGPVGIYQITASALEQGFVSLLSWIGLLSVNLGVINLLPIPALDGGRLVFLGYEAIARRKPNRKVENTFHYIFFLALMGLFVFIFFNDIFRLFGLK